MMFFVGLLGGPCAAACEHVMHDVHKRRRRLVESHSGVCLMRDAFVDRSSHSLLRCPTGASYVNVFHLLLTDQRIPGHDREFTIQLAALLGARTPHQHP